MGNNWKGRDTWSGPAGKQRSCAFDNSNARRKRRRGVLLEAAKVVAAVKRGDADAQGFAELVADLERFGAIVKLSGGRYRVSHRGSEKIRQVIVATKRLEEA